MSSWGMLGGEQPREWTPERRARHRKVTLAGQRRKRHVTPKALVAFTKRGVVSEELVSVVALRRQQYSRMADDLGGRDQITSLQIAVLDGWLAAQVVADVTLSRILADPHPDRLPERLATLLNTARSNLLALGLERRVREIETPSLESLIDAGATIKEQPESSPSACQGRLLDTN